MIRRFTLLKGRLRLLAFAVLAATLPATQIDAQTVLINPAGDGGFETGTTFVANGWTVLNNASATMNNWVLNTGAAGYTGARAAYISNSTAAIPAFSYDNTTFSTVHMYRDVTFPAGETNITFTFSEIQTGESGWDRVLVYISNAAPGAAPVVGTPSSNATALTGYTLISTTPVLGSWTTVTVPITAAQAGNASAASPRRILIVWQNDDSFGGPVSAAIDNISLTSSCTPATTGLGISSLGTTTAGLTWTATTGATSYNVRYKKTTDPVTVSTWATPTNTLTNSLAISSLTANTTYEYQVSAVGTSCAAFTSSFNFTTLCTIISTFPALESFTVTGLPTCWTASETATGSGVHWSTTTTDPTHGVTGPQSGTRFAYLDVYNAQTAYNFYYLTTPAYSLPAAVKELSYYYYLGNGGYTAASTPPLVIQVSTNGGGTWTDLYTHSSANSTISSSSAVSNWKINRINLQAYTSQTVMFRFKSNSNYGVGFTNQGIDEVLVGDPCTTAPAITATAPATRCGAGPMTLGVTTAAGAVVKWYTTATGGTPVFTGNPYVIANVPATTTYYVSTTDLPTACEAYIRTPVTATVTTAPAVTASSPQAPGVCTGTSVTITATSANTNYGYSWSTGQTTASFTLTPTATTTYTVTATDAGTGCVAKDSVKVAVNAQPAAPTITPITSTICQGSSVQLTTNLPAGSGTVFSENFSTATTASPGIFTISVGPYNTNPNTLGPWQIVTAPYTNSGFGSETLGGTGNKYIHADANSQNAITNTYFTTTNSYSTAGYSALTLTFNQFYQSYTFGNDSAAVDISTNNGSTWTNVFYETYPNSVGSTSTWSPTTVNLNAYVGFAQVKIRFRYYSNYGYYFAVDDIALNGTAPALTAKWGNVTGLYKNVALSQPLLTTDTNRVAFASPATTQTYTSQANSQGCLSTVSNVATVNVNPAPPTTITAGGPLTFCQGANVTLSAPTGTGLTYVWNVNGAPIVPAATGSTYVASTSGAYTVTVTNATPCTATTATPTTVVVNPVPPTNITASGSTIFCTGGSVTLTAPAPPTGTTYTYIWKNNNVAITGQTAISTVVSTTSNITVTVTNTATGCNATTPTAVVVTAGSPPAAPISAATSSTICQGQSVRLRTNNVAGLQYQWKLGGVDIPGAIDSFYNATLAGNYTVNVNIAGVPTCATLSAILAVSVNPLPPATITASGAATTFCQGGAVVLTGNTGTGLTYQWQVGASPTVPANLTSSYTASTSGSYTLVVTNTTTQCFNTSNAINVTVNPLPTATITAVGATAICAGTSVVLNANTGTGLTYQWFNGAAPGATTSSITANTAGSYTVRVTNANNCSATSAATAVTINPLPPTGITPTGTVGVCSGSTITLNGPTAPTGLTYQWKVGTTNATGTSTNATYTTGTAGAYRVVVTTAAGCRDSSAVTTITVLPLPTVAMTPTAATTGCDSVVLSTANTGVTYQWNYNNAPIIGANAATYAATVSGNYSLTNLSNANGCAATSSNVAITINQSPIGQITYSSPIIFCAGGAVVLNTYTGANQTYQWYRDTSAITGANTTTYITTESGRYSVKVINTATTCSRISQQVNVVVNALPTPVVMFDYVNNVLRTTTPYFLYQWYRNNQPIAGAVQSTYRPLENAAYTVNVTDSNGCTNLAPIFFVNSVGISNTVLGNAVKIYPNPASSVVYVDAPVKVKMVLRDVTGKTVLKAESVRELNVETLADGMYLLYISTLDGQLIRAEKITKSTGN